MPGDEVSVTIASERVHAVGGDYLDPTFWSLVVHLPTGDFRVDFAALTPLSRWRALARAERPCEAGGITVDATHYHLRAGDARATVPIAALSRELGAALDRVVEKGLLFYSE